MAAPKQGSKRGRANTRAQAERVKARTREWLQAQWLEPVPAAAVGIRARTPRACSCDMCTWPYGYNRSQEERTWKKECG